ncbi:S-layer protein [Halalkalibacter sp. APA_J-10(15)]|uniref:S-layer protein n=1 Tax=Halalkalibacter sp. APA_J-10(15) TaxID=2933805 RepID=UPI001FF205D5|nr:S-layer protein [Halalkalibacter sp. APA_J-10(15)]MCK0470980.1 S-layer protein [Halalkalibacter sp. APA_J-10(15)]
MVNEMKRYSTYWLYIVISLIMIALLVLMMAANESRAEDGTRTIVIDGTDVDEYNRFKGFGTVSANNTSRLMIDYKEEHPDQYWEMMHQLFDPNTGAGLVHVKVELGADVDSSSGTEPATMRYADEPANVLRGAGFQFAADAKAINPHITTEILRWGEPRWTWEGAANQEYENRYQWFKQTIDAVYEEFGFRLDYVGISQNERAQNNGRNELEWLKYYTSRMKEEPNYDEFYKDIKLVGGDGYRDTRTISQTLLDHPDLIDEIDVISSHYGLTGSSELTQLQSHLIAEGKEPKEIWSSEGVSPMINARYRINMEPHYQGLGGRYSIVDVTSRIISMYSWEGAGEHPLQAVSFDFQPSVGAFYQGSSYTPKHLINAFTPWNGSFEVDGGLLGVRHVMNFVGYNNTTTEENERWMYIKGATFSDGNFMDGGVDVDTSTHNYLTVKDPQSDDYTTVYANNTRETRHYQIEAKNLNGKENAPLYVWETRGPDAGQSYDANWFQQIDKIEPVDGQYEIEVKPYSLLTVTTLDQKSKIEGFEYSSSPFDSSQDTILPLPYVDDFEYSEYPTDDQGRDYVERRGGTPRYTTDQRGAFEVVKEATIQETSGSANRIARDIPDADERGNMLQQKITHDIIGADWAVWGGTDGSASNSNPHTNFGDYRWVNYKVSYDFLLDTHTPEVSGRSNYALIGLRHVKAGGTDSHAPYNARIYSDGRYEILKLGNVVSSGTVDGFNANVWNNLAFEAKENIFTLYVNDEEIAFYKDEDSLVMSGRAVIGSGYYETLYDQLRVDPIDGYPYMSEKYDSAQGMKIGTVEEARNNNDRSNPIGYIGQWEFGQVGYAHFNRTRMTASTDVPVWNGVTVGFRDVVDERGELNHVYYSGSWSSNNTNTWSGVGGSFEITFKGTEVRLFGITNPSNGTADIYLNGELVGEANYLNNSSIEQVVWSAKGLEDEEHTLEVVTTDRYVSFTKAEIETTDPVLAVTNLAPSNFIPITEDSEVGEEENTVYALRRNGNVWGSNQTNAWANFNDDPYLVISFTGSGIDYFSGTGDETLYNFELNGEDMGDFSVNPQTGIRFSIRDLEETTHTLKVSLKDNEIKEDFMDYRGVDIYSTPNLESSDTSMLFHFEGTGFNLFGATPDAVIDVYIDGELTEENYRVYSRGDRQTSYHLRGLDEGDHTAHIVVKGGTFIIEGLDIIRGASQNGDEGPGDGDEGPGDGDEGPGDGDEGPGDGDEGPGDGDEGPGDGDEGPGDGDEGPGDGDEGPGDGDEGPGDGDGSSRDEEDKGQNDEHGLPATATNLYNWLLVGIALFAIGLVTIVYRKRMTVE